MLPGCPPRAPRLLWAGIWEAVPLCPLPVPTRDCVSSPARVLLASHMHRVWVVRLGSSPTLFSQMPPTPLAWQSLNDDLQLTSFFSPRFLTGIPVVRHASLLGCPVQTKLIFPPFPHSFLLLFAFLSLGIPPPSPHCSSAATCGLPSRSHPTGNQFIARGSWPPSMPFLTVATWFANLTSVVSANSCFPALLCPVFQTV